MARVHSERSRTGAFVQALLRKNRAQVGSLQWFSCPSLVLWMMSFALGAGIGYDVRDNADPAVA